MHPGSVNGRSLLRLWVALFATMAALALPSAAAADHSFAAKWGSPGSGAGEMDLPSGIDADSLDNVYVADYTNNRIQKFSPDGEFLTQWGSTGTANGSFREPIDVAVDGSGDVYVADRGNSRIQKFDATGTFIDTWGSTGTGNGEFISPTGVATDSSGSVYVADYGNHRVQKFDSSGNYLFQWGTDGTGPGQFKSPSGIDVSAGGTVYVTDFDLLAGVNRVQRFDTSGALLGGWGSPGTADGEFAGPTDVTVSPAGEVFVADGENARVQQFNATGTFVAKWGSAGSGDGQFNFADGSAVATGSLGTVFVADTSNNRVQKFAAPIAGSTARLSGTRLVFEADAGVANTVSVSFSSGTYTVTDTDTVTPGAGCATASATSVTCGSGGITSLRITTNDMDDGVTVSGSGVAAAVVDAGPGNDSIIGGGGDDTLIGGAGDDPIAGGGGTDVASYANAPSAVVVTLGGGTQNTGGAGLDTLSGIEGLTGSASGDTLTGDTGPNTLTGADGNDTLAGSGGDDVLAGGVGDDRADYSGAATGVTVDLANTGAQNTLGAGSDTLTGVENLTGTPEGDTLTGSSAVNQISGGSGADVIHVEDSGPDEANCGDGADTATADAQDTTPGCETVTIAGGSSGGGGGGGGGAAAPPPATGGGGGVPATPLVLSGLGASKLRSGKSGSFRYTLSLAARVTLTIERPGPGRRSGKACKKQTKRNRKAKKCTFYAPVGKLTHAGKQGSNRAPFSGKPGGKAMKPGAYRLTAGAVSPSGARSVSISSKFTVTK